MGRKGLIAIVILIALFGVGAGSAFFVGVSLDAEPQGPVEEVVDPGKVAFIKLDPVTVPLVRRGRTERYMQISVSLEVPEGTSLTEVRKFARHLRDAFVLEINSRSVMRDDGSGLIDFESLKVRLRAEAQRILGRDRVNDVLLSNAVG
jgi:flagellar basal body-associated protein FliL